MISINEYELVTEAASVAPVRYLVPCGVGVAAEEAAAARLAAEEAAAARLAAEEASSSSLLLALALPSWPDRLAYRTG